VKGLWLPLVLIVVLGAALYVVMLALFPHDLGELWD
jgi:hypothetical protein